MTRAGRPASDVAFSDSVKAVQKRLGSRKAYARLETGDGWETTISPDLAGFIHEQRSFFLATANAAGQPYIQHRGGPKGFLRVLDDKTLGFELGDPLVARRQRRLDVGGLEAHGDVLRAVRVPGRDADHDRALGAPFVAGNHELCHQRGVVLDDARLAPHLHALAVDVVDEEEADLGVLGQVPHRDVLAIAAKVGEGERVVVEDAQEPLGPAAVLDVRLSGGARRGQEEAGLFADEPRQIG